MNQILDPVLRKDNFEIWRKKTNDIITLVSSISSNVKTTISDEPPLPAFPGDLWWDSSLGKLKIYYQDDDSSQWIDAFISSNEESVISISENPPENPKVGQLWWDSTTGKLKIYYHDGDSCQWTDAFSASGGKSKAEVTMSEDPPIGAYPGELWWDSNSGKLKILHQDIDSVQWIDAFIYHNRSVVGISDDLPVTANDGELIWDSSTGKLKIYYNDGDSKQWLDAFVYHNKTMINVSDDVPEDALHGELWWESCSAKLKIFFDDGDSKQWLDVFPVNTGSSNVIISENPPDFPQTGDLWWDSNSGKLKINYQDGDSSQWVDSYTSAQNSTKAEVVISEESPLNPFIGQLWWDSTTGKLKIYYQDDDSVQWIDAFIYHNKSIVEISNLPDFASHGELLWDKNQNELKIFFNDGVTTEWKNISEKEKTFQFIDDLSRDSFDLVDYDTKLTNLFYHSNPSEDWEINFSNVEFKTGDKFNLTVIVDNSSHFPLNVGINGQDVQVKWNKNVQMDSNNNPLIQENSTMKIVYEVYCLDSDISNALILADLNFF